MGRFRRGMIIGSIIGASIGAIANSNMMGNRARRRMIKRGRNLWRKTTDILSDWSDIIR